MELKETTGGQKGTKRIMGGPEDLKKQKKQWEDEKEQRNNGGSK